VLEVQFRLEIARVSNEKRIEVNIHSHCTAFRNDIIGHKIVMMVLSWLN